jgi:hypothetical protein
LFNPNLPLNYQVENTILMNLRHNLKRQEANRLLNTQWGFHSYYKPLSERAFSFGRIYITYRRKNIFITINKLYEDYLNTIERVAFKTSCGVIGYKGPKRATLHAKIEVAKNVSSYLTNQEFSSVDIIFPSGIGRVFKRIMHA